MSLNFPSQFLRIWGNVTAASAVLSPAAVGAGTTNVASTIAVPNCQIGDVVDVRCSASFANSLLVQGEVQAAGVVTLKFANVSAGSLTPPAAATYTAICYTPTVEATT
jgi:hypothetical protein